MAAFISFIACSYPAIASPTLQIGEQTSTAIERGVRPSLPDVKHLRQLAKRTKTTSQEITIQLPPSNGLAGE